MKNKLTDLNDHLFAQLERLADETLTPEQIEKETKRSAAIVDVADQVIRNAALQVQAAKMVAERGAIRSLMPAALGPLDAPQPKLIQGAGN